MSAIIINLTPDFAHITTDTLVVGGDPLAPIGFTLKAKPWERMSMIVAGTGLFGFSDHWLAWAKSHSSAQLFSYYHTDLPTGNSKELAERASVKRDFPHPEPGEMHRHVMEVLQHRGAGGLEHGIGRRRQHAEENA